MELDRGNRKLHYRLDGIEDGQRLVLLNSLGTSTASWDGVVEALKGEFRILRIDKAGHGASEPWAGARTISDNAEDVLAVLDHLSWHGVDICGVSIGGMTAIDLAARRPEAVRRLILSNTSAHVPPEGLENRIRIIRESGLSAAAGLAVGRFVSPGRARPDYAPYARALVDFNATDPESYIGWCHAIIAMDLRPLLAGISAPSLVITGDWDEATLPAMGRLIAESLPNAQLLAIAAGHLPFLDVPAPYAETVRTFLKDA